MLKALLGLLCFCVSIPAQAKLGETVPQLIKRFGNSYTIESDAIGKKYRFRSERVSVDVLVGNGASVAETYFSDHPLTSSGEPPNDIVHAVLKTNVPGARWVEIEASAFGADYALRSSDGKHVAILRYTSPQPENMIWTMTVGLAKSVHPLTTARSSSNPSPSPSLTPNLSAPPTGRDERPESEDAEPSALYVTGVRYYKGDGVSKNHPQAVKWFRRAADRNYAPAQGLLGHCYSNGEGVQKNYAEAVKWFRKAAEQNFSRAQCELGGCYALGQGVPKDYVIAYKWFLLAAARGDELAEGAIPPLENEMTREQIAEGQKFARKFKPKVTSSAEAERPMFSGTGFFITEDGYLVTNEHVAKAGARVQLDTESGFIPAKVVKVDAANDLALLKAQGKFRASLLREGDFLDGKAELHPTQKRSSSRCQWSPVEL